MRGDEDLKEANNTGRAPNQNDNLEVATTTMGAGQVTKD
jgi:hypothetical protein